MEEKQCIISMKVKGGNGSKGLANAKCQIKTQIQIKMYFLFPIPKR